MEICIAKQQNQPLSRIAFFETKIGEIFEKSAKRLKTKWNFARKNRTAAAGIFRACIFSDRTGRRSLRHVHFTELATKFNPAVETKSNLRRIQMFFSDYEIDYRVIAVLLMGFIDKKKCRISIDEQIGSLAAKISIF